MRDYFIHFNYCLFLFWMICPIVRSQVCLLGLVCLLLGLGGAVLFGRSGAQLLCSGLVGCALDQMAHGAGEAVATGGREIVATHAESRDVATHFAHMRRMQKLARRAHVARAALFQMKATQRNCRLPLVLHRLENRRNKQIFVLGISVKKKKKKIETKATWWCSNSFATSKTAERKKKKKIWNLVLLTCCYCLGLAEIRLRFCFCCCCTPLVCPTHQATFSQQHSFKL